MPRRGRFWRLGLLCLLLGLQTEACVAAQPTSASSRGLQVTAVFLFNFAQFIEWPAEAFSGAGSPMVIGVLGDDPVKPYLDAVVRNEQVGGRPLITRRFARVEEVDGCHVLFVTGSEAGALPAILQRLRGRSIVTVGVTPGFLAAGGMIQLVFSEARTRIRINLRAVESAGLTVSSKLLRFADVVGAPGN